MTHTQMEIIRVDKGIAEHRQDMLAIEWPLTILVNGKQYITLLSTPADLKELAVGFAYNEGLLAHKTDIQAIRLSEDQKQVELELSSAVDLAVRLAKTRVLTTGCGKGSSYFRAIDSLTLKPVTGTICLEPQQISALMNQFNKSPSIFVETGAVHGAALAKETLTVFREDVARHNSVDKLVGHLLLAGEDGGGYALITSGRITSELILKAARINIGMIISRSAPSSLAVELAAGLNVTLVGFARGSRFNIYCHPQRITGI